MCVYMMNTLKLSQQKSLQISLKLKFKCKDIKNIEFAM